MSNEIVEEDSDLAYALRLQRQETEQSFGTPILNEEGEGVDPDEMTYEDLLELGERMGNVAEDQWRLTGGAVVEALPVISFLNAHQFPPSAGQTSEGCLVCLNSYEVGECLKELPCHHYYHGVCISTWLESKSTCPLCKESIVPSPTKK